MTRSQPPLLCVCQQPDDDRLYLACTRCSARFHRACVPATVPSDAVHKFVCPECTRTIKPPPATANARRSRSARPALHVGNNPERTGTKWINVLAKVQHRFRTPDFAVHSGETVTLDYLRRNGFTRPFAVKSKAGLDMLCPEQLTVAQVAEIVGSDVVVDTVDVASQVSVPVDLASWATYFNSPLRDSIYNILSLEFSDTPLNDMVVRPRVVRDLDLLDRVWPASRADDKPKATIYCIMSVASSFTDFHIDFGGSSVFYHVINGSKIFYFIEPTEKHFELYRQCHINENPTELFELADVVYAAVVEAGQVFFIPSGWIHAVYTPEDSVVIGGNFLHLGALDMQCRIDHLEQLTGVPEKYRFSHFTDVLWYTVRYYDRELQACMTNFNEHEVQQLAALCRHLTKRKAPPPDDYPVADAQAALARLAALANLLVKQYEALNELKANLVLTAPPAPGEATAVAQDRVGASAAASDRAPLSSPLPLSAPPRSNGAASPATTSRDTPSEEDQLPTSKDREMQSPRLGRKRSPPSRDRSASRPHVRRKM
ncbi:Lysine-specific demethylase 7A [Allomyces arbusculus]|nr:Lysine-specific demethylase 7A [Allomyces arbusculus]